MADTPTNEQTAAAPAAAPVAAAPVSTTNVTPAQAAQKPTNFKVSLEHFATQLSSRDKRVALIHGWVHTERVAKHMRDLPANYQARYVAFENQPV